MTQLSGVGQLPEAREPFGEALADLVLEVRVEENPAGTSKSGRWFSLPLRSTSQRSAMSSVFDNASG